MAGIYGLLAVLTGAGGSLAQISMYMYSALALVGIIWGLKSVSKVSSYSMYAFYSSLRLLCCVFRRMQSIHSTLRMLSLPTTCSQRHGPYTSQWCGGFTHPTTVVKRLLLQRRRRLWKLEEVGIRPCLLRNAMLLRPLFGTRRKALRWLSSL